jgi:tetratricopeptide (TPR) repeat protein
LPTTALRLHLLGILRAHEGRYEEAEAAFRKAVEAGPEMVGSYVELRLVYACRGDYPEDAGLAAAGRRRQPRRREGVPGRAAVREPPCRAARR